MKKSEIYLKAAKALRRPNAFPDSCCGACFHVEKTFFSADAFAELFRPQKRGLGTYYWLFDDEGYEQRLFALCLAAAIAESEGE